MKPRYKALFVTIVPSPYQRDMFAALAARGDVDLSVCYMEAASPDSPWPEKSLRPFERIMPGFWVPVGGARGHVNWRLPDVGTPDFTVISSFTSLTGQWLMRAALGGRPWLFWGERLQVNSGLREAVQRRLAAPIGRASGIVGIGRAAEQDYQRRFPHVPHFCIPYHCTLEEFFAVRRAPPSGRPLTFFFCGQMIRRKGVDLLLSAFDRLIAGGADAELLLVGREADLPEFLATVGASARARIRYEGFQAPERLPEYFGRSDIFVLPSRYDGWGVVINQALAAGLPVITTDAVGAGMDYVADGVNGRRVPAGNGDALFRAMAGLVSDRGAVQSWGEQSRRKAQELTPEAGAEKWVQVFDALNERSGAARSAMGCRPHESAKAQE